MSAPEDFAAAAALLDESPDFRVLRRFQPRDYYMVDTAIDAPPLKIGLFVDVETTGLDTARDHVIELAMVPFEFDTVGHVYEVGHGSSWFNDPGVPIAPEITELTGITDEMVRGQSIDLSLVAAELARASLVVAHNADFDRRMLERVSSAFESISWGCSYREVEWERFGCSSKKLEHILASTSREFFDAHRALDDCYVGVHCLAAPQLAGRPALSYLLDSVRRPTVRVFATGAPFHVKDLLKARKYSWDATAKVWHIDVAMDALGEEQEWLRRTAFVSSPRLVKLTARDRYSVRSDR